MHPAFNAGERFLTCQIDTAVPVRVYLDTVTLAQRATRPLYAVALSFGDISCFVSKTPGLVPPSSDDLEL